MFGIGKRFVDSMDRTRMVIPVATVGNNQVECRVIFKDTGYNGRVTLPNSLFTESGDGFTGRIGFVMLAPKPTA